MGLEKEIIINSTNEDTRIALVEDKKLVELFVERPDNQRMVGDIYKGKVRKVVKGMQAAFIDIGFPQDAFLHFSDMGASIDQLFADVDEEDLEQAREKNENGKQDGRDKRRHGRSRRKTGNTDVEPWELLRNGQEIAVQIVKEPISNKGPRVTTELTLPGRYLVLVPNESNIGISRKIASNKERRRLRQAIRPLLPENCGLIVRTVAEGKSSEGVQQDLKKLLRDWNEVQEKIKTVKSPELIYQDLGMASSVIRDLFTTDVKRVVVDSRKMHKELLKYLEQVGSDLGERVEYFKSRKPIFDVFGIEDEIQRSLEKKVWMDNGGYIIVEHTEALTVVDVNSGRFFGRKNHERNSLKINLDASREIARQMRLRDVGGLIVVDFIDMEEEPNRRRVLNEMLKEFARDRSVTKIEGMSRFGLVEMTRQRIRPSLIYNFTESCPNCGGSGLVPTPGTILASLERALRRYLSSRLDRRVILQVHPDLVDYLEDKRDRRRSKLMWKYWVMIAVEANPDLKAHEFKILVKRNRNDVTEQFTRTVA
ncbi:MAG TPA: Rne/Rng family ribonuclease [Calditrichia bacterium]|nr:Rne/Rng family ribonuclease [Calditrichota bacterium]HQV30840.1 Rne/Rng family ribonuclease [Calditrichia bacterium]